MFSIAQNLTSNLWLGAGVSLLAGILYILGVIVYRLTLHPLAKYPGPFLAKITDWYIVIRSFKGDRHIELFELHKKHGPFVRFGPNKVSVNTTEGLQKIYGYKANTQKSSYYHIFSENFGGENLLTTVDPGLHAKKRKVIGLALSDNSIRAMEEIVLRNVRKFIQHLGESEPSEKAVPASDDWSSPKNMIEWSSYLAFDVMGDVSFSTSFEMLDKPDNRYILDILPQGVNGLNMGGWMPAISRLKLGEIFFPTVAKGLKTYEAFSEQQASQRQSLGANVPIPDVFSHMIQANKASSEKGESLFTPRDLVGESSLFIIAGSDTTAISITTTTFYLLHNPETYERLKEEIRPRFQSLEDIRGGATLNSCRWLRACIDEAMRMTPGMPGLLPREVLAPGVEIGREVFPKGVELGVVHYALHHNEDYYPDSFAYKPERWLAELGDGETKEESERRVALAQSAFCPFSIGPRGCVGKGLAMKEVMITMARMIWLYDMRLAPGEEKRGTGGPGMGLGRHRSGEQQITDMFVSQLDGPVVQFRRRI